MRITKALYHLFEHAYHLGWRRAIHVIRLKRSRKGGLGSISAPWLGGRVLIRPGTADMATIDQFLIGPYLPATTGDPPLTVVDCGANIGLASRYFKHAYPNALIVAIEPDEENHRMLQRNLEGLAGCHAVQAAVWPKDGRVSLQRKGLWHSAFRTTEATGADGTIEALSIPTIMQRFAIQRIGLLKVDIEGAEQELFGAKDLGWLDRVDRIAIELHDRFKPGCGNAFFKAMSARDWTYACSGEMIFCERLQKEGQAPGD